MVRKINFFRNFKFTKNFFLWKNLRARKHIQKSKELLEHQLYLMDAELRSSMLQIRTLNYKFMEWKLLDLESTKPRTMEGFLAA